MRAAVALVVVSALGLLAGAPAFTADNTVAGGTVSSSTFAVTANALKPAACAGISLDTIVIGSTGGSGNELILGSSNTEVMSGGGGNDCILGGGGADTIDGGAGTDVCIGGPGLDVFLTGCETQVQ
jgi:Ca2+-binding RTX toxin-like protein